MAKFKWQSVVQFEFDSDTKHTRVLKAFTIPIGETASYRKKGKDKVSFAGASKDGEVVL